MHANRKTKTKDKLFEPSSFINQFDFQCKFNKNYNRNQDCTDYLNEIKKEIQN